ncbi:hypothetical protein F1559_003854 [Cyanidiococcus yangmingshanensis]|uniref:Survival protein SurE-like phosphatase/nucleotidase domain-containing protein n=1 Tax=Cyanidiococcus yangmingshanensis TaxID=2690220 RepID=A0A7J7ILI5_9RHOD|nr:hypothetical protein F1559_003854 [Cyanidiococcus yangmingshanensis]
MFIVLTLAAQTTIVGLRKTCTSQQWVSSGPQRSDWDRTPSRRCSNNVQRLRFARLHMNHLDNSTERQPCILLTNDDGVESTMLLRLANVLSEQGPLEVVVIAPRTNQSACSHRLTLATPMELRHRSDLHPAVYALNGSPADCVITATEPNGLLARLGKQAHLVVSGPNIGANLAQDVLYSGTFSGARQAGLNGLPAIACSWRGTLLTETRRRPAFKASPMKHGKMPFVDPQTAALDETTDTRRTRCNVCGQVLAKTTDSVAAKSTVNDMVNEAALDLVWSAFSHGDLVLNVNFPAKWDWGKWRTTHLGAIFYRDVFRSDIDEQSGSVEMVTIGAQGRPEPLFGFVNSDLVAVQEGYASVTTLQTWPESHPLQANAQVVEAMAFADPDSGLPAWIIHRVSRDVLQQRP